MAADQGLFLPLLPPDEHPHQEVEDSRHHLKHGRRAMQPEPEVVIVVQPTCTRASIGVVPLDARRVDDEAEQSRAGHKACRKRVVCECVLLC